MRSPNTKDPKPLTSTSWWVDRKPEGFTQYAMDLWDKRYPTMAGVALSNAARKGVL